jgi:hypothetical protein
MGEFTPGVGNQSLQRIASCEKASQGLDRLVHLDVQCGMCLRRQ